MAKTHTQRLRGMAARSPFYPVQVIRRFHGADYQALSATDKRIVDDAMAAPPFGRKYAVSLWGGAVEVVTNCMAAELFIQRREQGMVNGKGGPRPLRHEA